MTSTLEEPRVDEVLTDSPLLCDWDNVEVCLEIAHWRSGFICCKEFALICTGHKNWLENYVAVHGDSITTCPVHGKGVLRDLLKFFPL